MGRRVQDSKPPGRYFLYAENPSNKTTGTGHIPAASGVSVGASATTLAFTKLLSLVASVLEDAPEVRDAIEERLVEICTNEHGHVSYNRLLSSAFELAETRLLLPITARALSSALPELCILGAFPRNVLQDLELLTDPRKLPEAIRRNAFMA